MHMLAQVNLSAAQRAACVQEANISAELTAELSCDCAGTIKRWHHHRGNMTHGSKSKRQHGSIGSSATPSRVLPGLKMAGQMGNKRRTIKGLEVRCLTPRAFMRFPG